MLSKHFCNKDKVLSVFEGKRVCVVGGAPSVLDNKIGYIDSFDVVVRVNNYKLYPETGFITDVYYSYFGGVIKKEAKDLKKDGVYLCICKCPNAKLFESDWHKKNGKSNGVDFRYIYEIRKDFWFCDTYIPSRAEFFNLFDLLDKHVPTSGFAAIHSILSNNPTSLYITGFDFFESGLHNVNDKWVKNNNSDPICHRPDLERDWIKSNLNNYPITLDKRLMEMFNDK